MKALAYLALGGAALGALLGGLVSRRVSRMLPDALIGAVLLPLTLSLLVALPGTFSYAAECALVTTAVTIFIVEGRRRL